MPLTMLITFEARGSSPAESRRRFEETVVPHLDAAYDLARWLTRSDERAEDVVQTACVRALRFFPGFRGGSPRAWLLAIVRNVFYSEHEKDRVHGTATLFDEEMHSSEIDSPIVDPETQLLRHANAALLRDGLLILGVPMREVLVLRELEGLSYREIAEVVGAPIGTVMSRLSRARQQLQSYLLAHGVEGRSR
jgi:RNA polymerase sigma factor (sigma-70 family)